MPIHYNCWVYKDDNKNHGSYYVCIYDFKISVVQELKKMHDAVSWKKKYMGRAGMLNCGVTKHFQRKSYLNEDIRIVR